MSETNDNAFKTIEFGELNLATFDRLLSAYVKDGVVDYPGFQADPDFASFVEDIGRVRSASLESHADKLSFYINAYNALVIKSIVDGYSPESFFGRIRFFVLRKHRIATETLSLLAIERRRIIPLGDPRTHFAINCASASCPVLASNTFDATDLDQQLDSAARRFISSTTKTNANGSAQASRIFKWYRSEFERDSGGLPDFLSRYIDDNRAHEIANTSDIEYDRYDWQLNGPPPR